MWQFCLPSDQKTPVDKSAFHGSSAQHSGSNVNRDFPRPSITRFCKRHQSIYVSGYQRLLLGAGPPFDLRLALAGGWKGRMRFDEEERFRPVVARGFAGNSSDVVCHPLREIESRTDIESAGGQAEDVEGGIAFCDGRGNETCLFPEVHVGSVEPRRRIFEILFQNALRRASLAQDHSTRLRYLVER